MAKKKKRRADRFEPLDVDPQIVQDAADCLLDGLAWNHTREGHAFWKHIYNRLKQIAKSAQSEAPKP